MSTYVNAAREGNITHYEQARTLYNPLRTSMGQFWMETSTVSEIEVEKSGLENSGWKKISGPRNRSYPTSTENGCNWWQLMSCDV